MKKIVKLLVFNVFAVAALFALVELGCRIDSRFHFIRLEPKDTSVQARMKGMALDRTSVEKELGTIVFAQPPGSHLSRYDDEALKNYSYADIDRTPTPDRQWTVAPDGLSRSSRYSRKIKNTGLSVFDVTYSFDPFNKRFVEGQSNKRNTQFFVLAAGDSFTFGEGVTQGQDYPSILASMLDGKWTVYNYGITGDSANDLLTRATLDMDYFSPVRENKGVFIWLYHDVQMQRMVFPTTAYKTASYIASKAEYTLEDNLPVFQGYFNKSDRAYRSLIDFMAGLQMTETFHLEIPKVYTEEHFQLFFSLLNTSLLRLAETNRHVTRKILVTFTAHSQFDLLKRKAEESGFEILDIEKVLYLRDKRFGGDLNVSIPVDGHPSPEAYWLLSSSLKEKYFR